MKRSVKFIILAAIFIILIAAAVVGYNFLSKEYQPDDSGIIGETKSSAPDFTVQTMDGGDVKLSDFFGKPVIINFWATWCGPCKVELPAFQAAYEEYGDEIVFLMMYGILMIMF